MDGIYLIAAFFSGVASLAAGFVCGYLIGSGERARSEARQSKEKAEAEAQAARDAFLFGDGGSTSLDSGFYLESDTEARCAGSPDAGGLEGWPGVG